MRCGRTRGSSRVRRGGLYIRLRERTERRRETQHWALEQAAARSYPVRGDSLQFSRERGVQDGDIIGGVRRVVRRGGKRIAPGQQGHGRTRQAGATDAEESTTRDENAAELARVETRHSVMLSAMFTSTVAVPSGPVMTAGLT